MTALWDAWLIGSLMTNKGITLLTNYIKGHTREVERIESKPQNVFSFLYNHMSNLLQEPSFIIDNIYLGSSYNSSNKTSLEHHGIRRILNVTCEIPCSYPNSYTYLQIPVRDSRDSFLESYFEEMYQFMVAKPDQPLLVHCYMGSSRSATIVIYYMMRRHGKTYQQALDYVKGCRAAVNLNCNFANELNDLEIFSLIPAMELESGEPSVPEVPNTSCDPARSSLLEQETVEGGDETDVLDHDRVEGESREDQ